MTKPRATAKPVIDVGPRIQYNLRPIARDTAQIAIAANARVSELEGHHRRGKTAGHVPWHTVVSELVVQGLTFPEIWRRLSDLANADHEVIHDVVPNNTDEACGEPSGIRAHPKGPHLHCRGRRDRLCPISAGTVENFVSRRRREQIPESDASRSSTQSPAPSAPRL